MPTSSLDNDFNKPSSSPYLTKQFISFWLAGVLNNCTYVVMNAGAKQIAPGAVGYVYVCNVLPSFLTQISGPYCLCPFVGPCSGFSPCAKRR